MQNTIKPVPVLSAQIIQIARGQGRIRLLLRLSLLVRELHVNRFQS